MLDLLWRPKCNRFNVLIFHVHATIHVGAESVYLDMRSSPDKAVFSAVRLSECFSLVINLHFSGYRGRAD